MNANPNDVVVVILTRDEAEATSRLIAAVAKHGGSAAAKIGGVDAAKREIDQAADIARRIGSAMTVSSVVDRAIASKDRHLRTYMGGDPFGDVCMRTAILAALDERNQIT